jgi:hypothetical protein
MASDGPATAFQVRIDGQPPDSSHGIDIDDEGRGSVSAPRLYQLVRQRETVRDRTFEITFGPPGVDAYVFTFG